MQVGTRGAAALAISGLLLMGCNGEEPLDEEPSEETTPDGDADDTARDESTSEEAPDDEADADDATAAGPVGTVTLDGTTVELEEAFWCEDHESAAGVTDMRIVGIAHGMIKLDAGAYTTDDGTSIDAVTIWEAEELDRGIGGMGVVAAEEGEDGYPWIQVDGQAVAIEGTYRGDDGADEAAFAAELTVEEEPRGSAFC